MSENSAATSPHVLRRLNAELVLRFAWSTTGTITANGLIAHTGLTRSTVIGVCDELVRRGWLAETDDAGADEPRRGRPARRYAVRAEAAAVVGVDAGRHRVSAALADLRGTVVARVERLTDGDDSGDERRRTVRAVIDDVVAAAGVDPSTVRALCIGVPAPTDAHGHSPLADHGFWATSNPGFVDDLAAPGRLVVVDNDANLAAIAEGSEPGGSGADAASSITLLSGERLGAGLVIDGRLLRGVRGGAGELRALEHVEGVGSTAGFAALIREWAREAVAGAAPPTSPVTAGVLDDTIAPSSVLHRVDLDASDVLLADPATDSAAAALVDRLAARLARICTVLGDLLDVDRVIVAGALAASSARLVDLTRSAIAAYDDPTAPVILASTLGADVVTTGAVHRALAAVRESALDLDAARSTGA
ncbi:ROK family protein [Agromyces atrinae]|uniref:ROK family protein n=1 Tax=Agromyces atrinae TaxID=592376 RepID=UPI001F561C19|nr:ROK family protein [Agromyces atrinae]MCI2956345.1 ROK family protein [Agromyces atrinae]